MGFFQDLAEGFSEGVGRIGTQIKNITIGPSPEYKAEQIENWKKAKAYGGSVGDSLIISGNNVKQHSDFKLPNFNEMLTPDIMKNIPMLFIVLIAVLLLKD